MITITESNGSGSTSYTLSSMTGVPTTLATVATTGSYNDLKNLPLIPAAQKNANWTSTAGVTAILNKPVLSTVATTGKYSDLIGLPSIPVLPTLSTVATTGKYSDLIGLPSIPVLPTLSTVATTGNYNDLINKPSIPVMPVLSTVATTGNYNDLINKPTSPIRTVKPSSYVLTLNDSDIQVDINSSVASTLTIPLNSKVPFVINSQIIIGQYGSGAVTIVGESGVTLRSSGNKRTIFDQYSLVTLKKLSTDEWLIVGNLK